MIACERARWHCDCLYGWVRRFGRLRPLGMKSLKVDNLEGKLSPGGYKPLRMPHVS